MGTTDRRFVRQELDGRLGQYLDHGETVSRPEREDTSLGVDPGDGAAYCLESSHWRLSG